MALHPPLLYLGYVLTSVPFAPGYGVEIGLLVDTYVVDRDGTIRWVVYGAFDERELTSMIDDVLA